MTDTFWFDYIINDLENMEYRIEDIILHSLTGMIFAVSLKIKKIAQRIKSYFT